MKKTFQFRKKKSTAQAMVEFALALPILLLVVYGLIETGRLVFIYASVVTAARQAARYGSATGVIAPGSTTPYYADCDGIKAAARRVAFIQAFSDINVTFDNGPARTLTWGCPIPSSSGHPQNGDRVDVVVTADYSPIVPLVPFGPFKIVSESNRTLLVGADITVPNPSQGFNGGTPSGLVLTKSATPQTYTDLGERITYTYTLQNTGALPIVGPFFINDDKIGVFECAGVPLTLQGNMSGSVSCNPVSYYITAGDLTSPEVTNHASASAVGSNVVSSGAVYTISFLPKPHLTLTKTGTPPLLIAPGEQIKYQFVLLNDGNTPLTPPYSISDPLIGSNWSCPSTPNPLSIQSAVTCTGTYTLKNTDIHAGSVHNTATASAFYNATQVTGTGEATVPTPPLGLTLSANPSSVNTVGAVVTYTYTVTNFTTSGMTNITVTDTRGANNLACVSSLAAGQTATCQNTYTVTQADLNGTSFRNSASAAAKGNVGSNVATFDVLVSNVPQLTLTKTVEGLTKVGNYYVPPNSAQTFPPNTTLRYDYSFLNTGNVTVNAPFVVTDDKLGPVCTISTGSMAPGGPAQTCPPVDYALTDADLAAGSITNNATVTGYYNSVAVIGKASATVITFTDARLGISKTASPYFFTAAGNSVLYTYNLVNTGGLPLTVNSGYAVTDDKIGTITCHAIGNLPVGASAVCNTAPYTITAADELAASVTNNVNATPLSTTTPATAPPVASTTVFICPPKNLTGQPGTFTTPQPQYDWIISNSARLPVYIASLTVTWDSGGVVGLQQVILNNVTIFSPTTPDLSGSITLPEVPAGSWSLTSVKNYLHFAFTGNASNVHVTINIVGCNFTLSS